LAEQSEAKVKQAGEHVEETVRDARDSVRDAHQS
jgi:outer membrane protein TolC